MEKNLFVSDIHGFDKNVEEKLSGIIKKGELPSIVFFLGDIVGNEALEILQKKFYGVFNKMKTLKNASDEEILGEVYNESLELENELHKIDPGFYIDDHSKFAIEISQYVHFGHFISNLPQITKSFLKAGLEINARRVIDLMTDFTDAGVMVVVVEGNWDVRIPLDFYPTPECKAIPVEERDFYFKDYLKSLNNKVLYFDDIAEIETNDINYVICPFDATLNFEEDKHYCGIPTNKKTILVSHTQVSWEAIKKDTPKTKEGEIINSKINDILTCFLPDEVVHGHLHDQANDYVVYMYDKEVKVHYLPKGIVRFI